MVAQGQGLRLCPPFIQLLDPRFQPYTPFLVHVHHIARGRSRFPSHIPILLNLHLLVSHGPPCRLSHLMISLPVPTGSSFPFYLLNTAPLLSITSSLSPSHLNISFLSYLFIVQATAPLLLPISPSPLLILPFCFSVLSSFLANYLLPISLFESLASVALAVALLLSCMMFS